MLVVTANWAIPDGSVAAPPHNALSARLVGDVRLAAVRAGFRRDGRYRPIERLVLVLAGDTFDGLLSDRWLDGVRPWERRREAMVRHGDVFRLAWRHARRPLAVVARLARRGIAVPSSDRHGRPVLAARVSVPVHVVMLLGDRDTAFERLGGGMVSGRRAIGLGTIWDGDGLRVAHGNECDPLAAREGEPTLLASLTVDLLARFGAALVTRPMLADRGRRIVRALADGQPLDMPLRLRAAVAEAADAAWIIDAWRRSVDRWTREALRWGCDDDPGAVDAIAGWMHALGSEPAARPAARGIIAALSAPLPPGAGGGRGRRLTVFGHPGPGDGDAAGRIVCLGPSAVRPCTGPPACAPAPLAVTCVEAGGAPRPFRWPAVAVLEADEADGHESGWSPMWEPDVEGIGRPGAVPILDAA